MSRKRVNLLLSKFRILNDTEFILIIVCRFMHMMRIQKSPWDCMDGEGGLFGIFWRYVSVMKFWTILIGKTVFWELILEKSDLLTFFQKENGGVGWIIQNKDTYDSSATAGYAYFYAIVYRICRDKKFYDISQKALKCLMASTQRNGAVDYSQGDTKGIGMYSNVFSIMPFTQGLTYLTICKLSEEF